ncbi:class I SAM-dependent methyltransferase [Azospirillum sp.]|uniref:class I SAM-dependent methyltransferase n=1 Tax=Azospirillum sp. TaxID=34012 RepID=UPI002D290B7A|nr:class I SAM-dependent methyltransferase [Azospirillum sp.]HYD71238.1 class I SAM-dependent methyltransferase [Azospirillum sp.]
MPQPDLTTASNPEAADTPAARMVRRILKDDPQAPSTLTRLVAKAQQSGREAEAATIIETAAAAPGRTALFHTYLGLALEALGRGHAAEAAYRRALALDGDFFQAHMALARIRMPGPSYYAVLEQIHALVRPRVYVEIGVDSGRSLALAGGSELAIGVDPAPQLSVPLPPCARVLEATSDDALAGPAFPALLDGRRVDMAFIDGLHTFDQALRDFVNLERLAAPGAIYLFHDVVPLDPETADRQRRTTFWSGDTWKVLLCLCRYRPDLGLAVIPASPTGLGVVVGLDPANTRIAGQFSAIVAEGMAAGFAEGVGECTAGIPVIPNDPEAIRDALADLRGR